MNECRVLVALAARVGIGLKQALQAGGDIFPRLYNRRYLEPGSISLVGLSRLVREPSRFERDWEAITKPTM